MTYPSCRNRRNPPAGEVLVQRPLVTAQIDGLDRAVEAAECRLLFRKRTLFCGAKGDGDASRQFVIEFGGDHVRGIGFAAQAGKHLALLLRTGDGNHLKDAFHRSCVRQNAGIWAHVPALW